MQKMTTTVMVMDGEVTLRQRDRCRGEVYRARALPGCRVPARMWAPISQPGSPSRAPVCASLRLNAAGDGVQPVSAGPGEHRLTGRFRQSTDERCGFDRCFGFHRDDDLERNFEWSGRGPTGSRHRNAGRRLRRLRSGGRGHPARDRSDAHGSHSRRPEEARRTSRCSKPGSWISVWSKARSRTKRWRESAARQPTCGWSRPCIRAQGCSSCAQIPATGRSAICKASASCSVSPPPGSSSWRATSSTAWAWIMRRDFDAVLLEHAADGPPKVLSGEAAALWGAGNGWPGFVAVARGPQGARFIGPEMHDIARIQARYPFLNADDRGRASPIPDRIGRSPRSGRGA